MEQRRKLHDGAGGGLSHGDGVHLAACLAEIVRELSPCKGHVNVYFYVDDLMDKRIRILLDNEVEVNLFLRVSPSCMVGCFDFFCIAEPSADPLVQGCEA